MEQSIQEILKTIDGAVNSFQAKIPNLQKLIYSEMQPLLQKLEVKDGKILNRVANLKLIGDIKNTLQKIIVNSEYKKAVSQFADSFDAVSTLQAQYFSQFNNKFKPTKTHAIIKDLAVQTTINDLIGQGLDVTITGGIEKILRENITTGGSYASLNEELRNHVLTNDTGEGSLERYTKQITTDAINQYNAQYHDAIAQDLNFNWGRYVGSNITTSREFCILLTEKQWVKKTDLPEVIKGHIDGEECKLSKSTGLPLGMIPGTNVDNFKIRRGGYNCGHQWFWVPDSAVPDNIKNPLSRPVPVEPAQLDKLTAAKVETIKNNNQPVMDKLARKNVMFYDDIASHWVKNIKLEYDSSSGSYTSLDGKQLVIGGGTNILNEYYQKRIMAHEGAHAMHIAKKIITEDHIDEGFKTFFNKLKTVVKGKEANLYEELDNLYTKHVDDFTLRQQLTIYMDTLGGLTRGAYGRGHSFEYYRTLNRGEMEVFAHALTLLKLENQFSGINDTIKELTDLMKAYASDVLK